MSAEPNNPEEWRRLVLELRAGLNADRAEWGSIDDAALARFIGGESSPEERKQVESAMERYPNVREAIELATTALAEFDPKEQAIHLRDGTGVDVPNAHINLPQASSSSLLSGERGRGEGQRERSGTKPFPWSKAALLAVAASLLVALAIYWANYPRPGEVLVAQVVVQYRDVRGGEASGFRLLIHSPRDGEATVVRLVGSQWHVWPRPGEPAITVRRGEATQYGPFDMLAETALVWVVVTDRSAVDITRPLLQGQGGPPSDPDEFSKQIQQALWRAGHRWVAINHVLVQAPTQQESQKQDEGS